MVVEYLHNMERSVGKRNKIPVCNSLIKVHDSIKASCFNYENIGLRITKAFKWLIVLGSWLVDNYTTSVGRLMLQQEHCPIRFRRTM